MLLDSNIILLLSRPPPGFFGSEGFGAGAARGLLTLFQTMVRSDSEPGELISHSKGRFILQPDQAAPPLPSHWGVTASVKDVAAFLGWSVETIYQLADSGKLAGRCSDGTPYKRRQGKRGRRGLRILSSSVIPLLIFPLPAQVPSPAPPQVEPPPPTPPKQRPPRSRVVLPYPGRKHSGPPAGTPCAQKGANKIA